MAAYAPNEALWPPYNESDMPNGMSRWDSHQPSPKAAEVVNPALGVGRTPYTSQQQWRAQGNMSSSSQLGASRIPNGGSTALDEEESCDEEIISDDAVAIRHNRDPSQLHVPDAAMPFISQSTLPSQSLLRGKNGEDIQEIGQWYFVCQLPEKDYEFFKSVQENWVKYMWDMGRQSDSIFAVLGAFAKHKKATLGEPQAKSEYYEQKGRIIENIVSDLRKSPEGPEINTLVAMAILAYLDIRDDQLDASGTHLRAVSNFVDMTKMSPSGWLYCVWIDLRQALFTLSEPSLPFYVPTVFREVHHQTLGSQQREAFRAGATNASHCPRSPVFTLDMASDLFGKLHALCYCSDVLASTETPPFGQVYALEFGLRVIQARAKRTEDDVFTSPIMLITSAIQLHVWMAARFYTPQARETHLGLINQACEVIDGFQDMVTQWYITAGLESLLWVLFTLVATFRAHELPQTTQTVGLLYQALRKARINSCDDFEARLKNWPWLANWHPVQIEMVWGMLCARYPDLVPRIARLDLPQTHPDPNKARNRLFLGGLEFYNRL